MAPAVISRFEPVLFFLRSENLNKMFFLKFLVFSLFCFVFLLFFLFVLVLSLSLPLS